MSIGESRSIEQGAKEKVSEQSKLYSAHGLTHGVGTTAPE